MSTESSVAEREFYMTDSDFSLICDTAYKYTGIVLGDHKRDMVYGRLARRLRELGLRDFASYCGLITRKDHEEVSKFINAITTNLTSFFRENHHFEFLGTKVCAELNDRKRDRRLRAWSAGSSTGEEPYSIAITLHESLDLRNWDCKLLATDLDSKVLDKGRQGIYEIERIESLAPEIKKRWFIEDVNHPDIVKVKPALQDIIRFKRLNLLERWPMKGPFDFIFCRNVMIYFNMETQKQLLEGFANMLAPGGYLFIGHSESLHRVTERFTPIGKTIYQKVS